MPSRTMLHLRAFLRSHPCQCQMTAPGRFSCLSPDHLSQRVLTHFPVLHPFVSQVGQGISCSVQTLSSRKILKLGHGQEDHVKWEVCCGKEK